MENARQMRDDRGKGNILVVEDGEETVDQMGVEELKVRREGGSGRREETGPDGSGGTEGKEGDGMREEGRD